MHRHDASTEVLTQAVVRYAVDRIRLEPAPLDGPRTPAELRAMAGNTVTPLGLGGLEALRVFADVLAPACISIDHPRFLSFVPAAPTEASILFDLVVGASSVYAGSWLEGGGAVFAENEALRWIADLAGMPESAGGVFVSGGTAGNLSALIAARWKWRHDSDEANDRTRGLVMASSGAHSSIAQAGVAMDVDVVAVPADDAGRMHGAALRQAVDELDDADRSRLFAVVATSGTTNAGIIDDLVGVADVCDRESLWFHVDGAYGGAGLAAPSVRSHFDGIERADSFIVDPHKWLFAPYDCCALLYRNPADGRAAHSQHATYLDSIDRDESNPADLAMHLSRRVRGLPFWFSLATHGTQAYTAAVERSLTVAQQIATGIEQRDHLRLVLAPELSVLLFERVGWNAEQYAEWSARMAVDGVILCVPTTWEHRTVLRLIVINPETRAGDVLAALDSLGEG